MSKILDKKHFILGMMLSLLLVTLIITCIFAANVQAKNKSSWIIQSVEDTVVLLNNGEVVEVFGNIAVDTLPTEDKKHLEMGISFLTKDEAMTAIEDYDG